MKLRRPQIYVGVTARELKVARGMIYEALRRIRCAPVTSLLLGGDYEMARRLINAHLSACDGFIHLAGSCFGAEPAQQERGEARRSYAHLEWEIASKLRIPTFVIFFTEEFPFEHCAEEEDFDAKFLQRDHREKLWRNRESITCVGDLAALRDHMRRREELFHSWRRPAGRVWSASKSQLRGHWNEFEKWSTLTRKVWAPLRLRPDDWRTKIDFAILFKSCHDVATETGLGYGALAATLSDERRALSNLLRKVAASRSQVERLAQSDCEETAKWEKLDDFIRDSIVDAWEAGRAIEKVAGLPREESAAAAGDRQHPSYGMPPAIQGSSLTVETKEEAVLDADFINFAGISEWDSKSTKVITNLANVLWTRGRHMQSAHLYKIVLRRRQCGLGAMHPQTLSAMSNLATALGDWGQPQAAEEHFRQALAGQMALLGPEHEDTLFTANNLAILLRQRGRLREATRLSRHALRTRTKTLGPEDFQVE